MIIISFTTGESYRVSCAPLAGMAELVDAPDSKSGELITREGSIPSPGTIGTP